jgi:hypothetical protein
MRCPARSMLVLVILVGSRPQSSFAQAVPQVEKATESHACSDAANARLGMAAVVLKCGRLNANGPLEALAVIKRTVASAPKYCMPVSQFAVLRLEGTAWKGVLEGANEIRNPEGYIALDYIDDSPEFYGYCLGTSKERSDGKPGFSILLNYFSASGEIEGSSTEVSWNGQVGRYQEFSEVEGFRKEVKNPPHVNTRKGRK